MEPGFHWSLDRWPTDRDIGLPAPAVLVLAPAMGAAFAMSFPSQGWLTRGPT